MTENVGAHAPAPVEDSSSADKQKKIVAGVLAGALAVGAGAYFLLLSGGDEEEDFTVQRAPRPAATQPAADAENEAQTPAAAEIVPVGSTLDVGRNPFKALFTPPVASGDEAAQEPLVAEVPAPVSTPAPVVTVVPIPAPAPPAEPEPELYALRLVSITQPTDGTVPVVTFRYDAEEYEVIAGQRFGNYGELVVLAYTKPDAAGQPITELILQVGDAAPITMQVGDLRQVL